MHIRPETVVGAQIQGTAPPSGFAGLIESGTPTDIDPALAAPARPGMIQGRIECSVLLA